MAVEVPNRDFARDPGIMHFETRIEITDARIPGKKPVTYERSDHRRADRLRDGRQLKHCIGVNGIRLAHFADAKPSCENDFILKNHGDGDAGDSRRAHFSLGELLEFGRSGLDLFKG